MSMVHELLPRMNTYVRFHHGLFTMRKANGDWIWHLQVRISMLSFCSWRSPICSHWPRNGTEDFNSKNIQPYKVDEHLQSAVHRNPQNNPDVFFSLKSMPALKKSKINIDQQHLFSAPPLQRLRRWSCCGQYAKAWYTPTELKLVGGWATPLKNHGVRQLGWWHSQLNGKS